MHVLIIVNILKKKKKTLSRVRSKLNGQGNSCSIRSWEREHWIVGVKVKALIAGCLEKTSLPIPTLAILIMLSITLHLVYPD